MNVIPEIDVHELADKLKSEDAFVLLDVRELWELNHASLQDMRLKVIPTSLMAQQSVASVAELPKNLEILVLCHHGIRSANVTRWLLAQGWQKVFSVRGGIHQYAQQVDHSVNIYH